jgi:hypothetical protein
MTGAAIVRREAEDVVVLAVHGSFDGAAAWALRIEMDQTSAREFVIDLTHAEEACEFAACLLERWTRERRLEKRVRFLPGEPEHARLLSAWGLEPCIEAPALAHAVDIGVPLAAAGAVEAGAAPTLAEEEAVA